MLAAVCMSWPSAFNSLADGEFILTAVASRAKDGSGPPVEQTGYRMFMGRQLSPIEASPATTTAVATARPVRPEASVPNQPLPQGSSAFVMGSTFMTSHIRALGRTVISLNPSQDSTRFSNDPHARHAVAEGIARLAEAPLHAITTSFTPTTSSNVGTLVEQHGGFNTRGSVTADFTVTFQAEPMAQEGGQPVLSLMHFPKAALFGDRIQNNSTSSILGTFILDAIKREMPGVQPYVLEVLELSLLLFEELSVTKFPGVPSEEPVPSRSDDAWSTWLNMALVASGATIAFVAMLIGFVISLWWCCLWRRFSGGLKANVHCASAANTPPEIGTYYPQWLHRSPAEHILNNFTTPVAQQYGFAHSAEKGQSFAGDVDSVVVRYSKGKRCFEKKVPYSRVDTSIRRPYLRKQKVNMFSEELNAWVPGTIEVAHTDDSLVVLYEKDGMQCRSLVPQILVESRIRRVNAGRSSIW